MIKLATVIPKDYWELLSDNANLWKFLRIAKDIVA